MGWEGRRQEDLDLYLEEEKGCRKDGRATEGRQDGNKSRTLAKKTKPNEVKTCQI